MLLFKYLFDLCINTSIKGAILIILILCLRKFFKGDFNAKWSYALWSIALVRLLFPFTPIKNVFSLYNLGLVKRVQFNIKDVLLGRLGSASDTFEIIGRSIETQTFINESLVFDWKNLMTIIWMAGTLLLFFIFCYIAIKIHIIPKNAYKYTDLDLLSIIEKCRIKISLRRSPELYISSKISSPMALGILFPKVVIPESVLINMKESNIEHIFLHELVHIKNHDVLFTTIGMLVCVFHWFNPLVWIAFLISKKDCELACDESVLKYLTHGEYIQYGYTLIKLMEYVSRHNSLNPVIAKTLVNDRAEANERVFQITTFKAKRKPIAIFSVFILLFISLVGTTESSSTRPSTLYGSYHLPDYLQTAESNIRQALGEKPINTYLLNSGGSPYFILDYSIFGERVQFWYDGSIGNNSRKTLEITTTSYKGIKQGMSTAEVEYVAKSKLIELSEVQETVSFDKYIYKDTDCHIEVLFDGKSDKVYSLTLY